MEVCRHSGYNPAEISTFQAELTVTVQSTYDGDHYAYVLEFFDKGRRLEQLWIDPDRGYICPREKRFDITDGSLREDHVSENFMLDEHSQKWFPTKVTSLHWSDTGQEMIKRRSEVHVMPGTLILNQPIPDSVFSLAIAQWDRILDTRREDNSTTAFIAKQPAILDLPTVEDKDFLDNADWITTRPVRQHIEPPRHQEGGVESDENHTHVGGSNHDNTRHYHVVPQKTRSQHSAGVIA